MFQWFRKKKGSELAAVADGKSILLDEVNDPVFAGKALGDGIAIIPEDGTIVAPCDGALSLIAPTLHAFGMTCEDGLELMVHIGIDTVSLNGEGFEKLVSQGTKVCKGQPVIRFDQAVMQSKGIDMTTMLIILNDTHEIQTRNVGVHVKKGEDIVLEYSAG